MKPIELANKYLVENHSVADNDFQNAMNIAVMKAFLAGYKSASQKAMSWFEGYLAEDCRIDDWLRDSDVLPNGQKEFIKFMEE